MAAGADPTRTAFEAGEALGDPSVIVDSSRRSVPMRTLRFVGRLLATLVIFALASVVAVVLHLNLPRTRRIVAQEVGQILAQSFRGRITIDELGQLGLFGVAANATVDDPSGRPVLVARGMRVQAGILAIARSALFGRKSPLAVELSDIAIDTLDVRLDTDASGTLELVNAFSARTPSPTDPNARGVRLVLPHIALRHGWAHGQMAGAPPLDVDVDDLVGAFTYAPDVLEGDVSMATILARRIANEADLKGLLQAHAKKPSDPKATFGAHAAWQGTLGGISETVRASFDDNKVDATVDVPGAAPENIRTFWAGSPIDKPVSAHVEAHGILPNVAISLHAGLGQAVLHGEGTAFLGEEKKAKFTLDAHDIDIREFAASAPTSRVAVKGDVSGTMRADQALTGDFSLHFLGGTVGTSAVPGAFIRASMSRSDPHDLRAHVDLLVDQPSAPAHLTAQLSPKGTSSALDFALDANIPSLDHVPQLHHTGQGSCRLATTGSMDLGTMALNANLQAGGEGIAYGTTSAESVSIDASAWGSVTAPNVQVAIQSKEVSAAGVRLTSADLAATGRATAPHVTASVRGPNIPDADAIADVHFVGGLSFDAVRLGLTRGGELARITADRIKIGNRDIRVDGARIEGLGKPAVVTMAFTRGSLRAQASSHGIDLARVGRLAHVEQHLKQGTLAFDADIDLRRDGASGRGTLDLSQATIEDVKDVALHVQADLDGRKFTGNLHAQAGGIGFVDVAAPSLTLGGTGPLSWAAWRQGWGEVAIDAHADLAKVAAFIPPDKLPFSEASGEVTIKAHTSRDDIHDLTPDLTLTVTTNHLIVAPKTQVTRGIDGVWVMAPPPWRLSGFDFSVDADIDGGNGFLKLSSQVHDAKGKLLELNASVPNFPYGDILDDNGRLAADLRTTQFELRAAVPERWLGSLPTFLKQNYVTGKIQGEVTVAGTMLVPKVHLDASLRQSRFEATTRSLPLEFELGGDYDGRQAKATLKGRTGKRELLNASAQADAAVAQFLDTRADSPPVWQASARAHLAGFPLEAIVFLDDKVISGQLSGDVSITDLHRDAHAEVTLSADSLMVGSVGYKFARVQAKADGHVIDATARVEQADGFAETTAHAVASWGRAFAPTLDPAQPLDLALSSKNFRIAGMLPFLDRWLDELDGRLDADTRLRLDPTVKGAQLSGSLALSRGTLEAVAGGGQFHDIAAKVDFSPDGVISLEKLTASGVTGRVEVTGSARLQGLNLESARAIVIIPSDAPIPVNTVDSEIGNVDGRIEISEVTSNDAKAIDVKVEVPRMRVALPEDPTKNAQSLGTMDKVLIGAHRGYPQTFVLVPLDPAKEASATSTKPTTTRTSIHINLGDIEVVRGKQLKIDLTGQVEVRPREKPPVTGQITLQQGGVLDVEGRAFRIESGTITFVGADPSNPEVVVTAGWAAPEGTVVYANFVGPLKTGKVTLNSEPPLPQQDIVELLRFGTTGGQQAHAQGTEANGAIGLAGGQATQPLNHALGQLGLGVVTAKIDTTEATAPKPEVEVQIAKDISVQIAVVLGTPPPGVNPDHTLVTIDWRFLSRWSLSSTVGDAGTTIFDVLWQRRY